MPSYLFSNGPIYPMAGPGIVGGALLTRDGTIDYVGPEEGLPPARARGAERVDLAGRPLLPGLCDAHLHLVLAAEEHASLDCRGVRSVAQLQQLVRQRCGQLPEGSWVTGHGWERKLLFEEHRPAVAEMDAVAPHHPLFLASKDLHSAWLNSDALARMLALPDLPPKCVVQRDAGLVLEEILELRRRLVPARTDRERQVLVRAFVDHLHATGITAVHSHEPAADLRLVHELYSRPGRRVRVLWNLVFHTPDELRENAALLGEAIPGWLCPGGIKLFLDGTFGSLTAAISEPYNNTRDDRGILNLEEPELLQWLEAIHELGTRGAFHTIGDRSTELLLRCLRRFSWPAETTHRLEHAQLFSPAIVAGPDLAGLAFSAQPSHMWGDREIVARHLPPALVPFAYPLATMQAKGGLVVLGSDAPVEPVDPWRGIQAAVTRLRSEGVPPWNGNEALSLFDAIAGHTANPRRLHGHCFDSGVLAAGSLADLVVLNTDPFVRPPEQLAGKIRAELTFVDGELVYARG